jgi:hypothetical protein
MALTKATNRMIDGASVNVKDYGAVCDGVTDDTTVVSTTINAVSTGEAVYIPENCLYYYQSLTTTAKARIENSEVIIIDYSRSLFGGAPAMFLSKHLAITGDLDMFNPGGSGSDLTWIEQDGDATKELCIAVYEYASDHLNIKVGAKRLGEVQVTTGALTTINRASGNTTDLSSIVSSGDTVRIERATYTVTGTPTSSQFTITTNYSGTLDVDVFAHKTGLNSALKLKGGDIPETELSNYLTITGENDQGVNGLPLLNMKTWDSVDGYLDRIKFEVNSSGVFRIYTRDTAGSAWMSAFLVEDGDTPGFNFQSSEYNGNLNFDSTSRKISLGGPQMLAGAGTPETNVTAVAGSTYMRTDGGAGTSFYVKESGTGATGWVGK